MEFVDDCPFTMLSGEEGVWSESCARSVSSFGSVASSLATTVYSCTSVPMDSEYFAQHSERIYNEFRKWMSTRYISNPDYVEADMHMFRDEWHQFVRTGMQNAYEELRVSLSAPITSQLVSQLTIHCGDGDCDVVRSKLSGRLTQRIKKLLRNRSSNRARKAA